MAPTEVHHPFHGPGQPLRRGGAVHVQHPRGVGVVDAVPGQLANHLDQVRVCRSASAPVVLLHVDLGVENTLNIILLSTNIMSVIGRLLFYIAHNLSRLITLYPYGLLSYGFGILIAIIYISKYKLMRERLL